MMRERVYGYLKETYDYIRGNTDQIALGLLVIPASILALKALDRQINIEQETLTAWQEATRLVYMVDRVEAARPEEDSIAKEGVIFDAAAQVQTSEEEVYFPADMFTPEELTILKNKGIDLDFIPLDIGMEILTQRSPEIKAQAEYKPGGYGPSVNQTSEFAAGSSVINVVLVESEGPESQYDWTPETEQLVKNKFEEMVTSWKLDAPSDARLESVLRFQKVSVFVEPTLHPHTDDTWLYQAFEQLGYPTGSLSDRARAFNYAARKTSRTDWGELYFIPLGVQFTDDKFAWAFLFGPYSVITFEADGWGRYDSDAVYGHERGHLLGALDQRQPFTCDMFGGYLRFENCNATNQVGNLCRTNEPSRMRWWIRDRFLDSICGRAQVGWHYSTDKPIIDVLNTTPEIFWKGESLFEIQDIPWPSPWRDDVTINKITEAWRYDSGIWQPLVPQDGNFGGYTEGVEVPLDRECNLIKAENTVGNSAIRAFDKQGNQIAPETLIIDPSSMVMKVPEYCCLQARSFACEGAEVGPSSVVWEISPGAQINEFGRIWVARTNITQTLTVTATESSGLTANSEIIVPPKPLEKVYLPIIINSRPPKQTWLPIIMK